MVLLVHIMTLCFEAAHFVKPYPFLHIHLSEPVATAIDNEHQIFTG